LSYSDVIDRFVKKMRRFHDRVNAMTNSTHSSILNEGLGTSQFAIMSDISEREPEENNPTNTYAADLD
jgi:hypothetical protein